MLAPAHISEDSDSELPTKVATRKHSTCTHVPKDRNCEIQRTKITRALCRKRTGEAVPRAEKFGDLLIAHHKILDENGESRNNHRYAVVVNLIRVKRKLRRRRKGVYESLSSRRKSRKSCPLTFLWNLAMLVKIYHGILVRVYPIDPKQMVWLNRAVRRIKEKKSAILLRSSLDEKWWAVSMECYRYLRSVQDLQADGRTPYERRFGDSSQGRVTPFGAMVEYHLISAEDRSRLHQFGKCYLEHF